MVIRERILNMVFCQVGNGFNRGGIEEIIKFLFLLERGLVRLRNEITEFMGTHELYFRPP